MPSDDPPSPGTLNPDTLPTPVVSAPVARSGKERPYHRLPGRMTTFRVGSYGLRRLYLGADHLLQVEAVFCVENYQRFAYADIQSLLLRQTSRGLVLSIILGVLAAGFGALAWASSSSEGRIACLVTAGFFVLLLGYNLVRGTTCRCELQTAIGPQPLPTLNRLRVARKAFALLTERVEAIQGVLPPGEASIRIDEQLTRRGGFAAAR